jgi:uncharacterized damage-inducible protein DinB
MADRPQLDRSRCTVARLNQHVLPASIHTGTMRREALGELLDYLFWVRDRVLAATAELSDGEFRSRETVATRDLRATLAHQLEHEWAWRIRLSLGSFPAGDLVAEDYPALGDLVTRWHRDGARPADVVRGCVRRATCRLSARRRDVLPLWQYLVYVVTHGIQQFSEGAVLLTRLGHSPGEVGYLAFRSEASLADPATPPTRRGS